MLREVSERLVARGHEVTVFTLNGATQKEVLTPAGGGLPEFETISGVRVRRFTPAGWATRVFRGLSGLPGGWRAGKYLFREGVELIRRRSGPLDMLGPLLTADVDVVVANNWVWAPAYAAYLARRFRNFALVGAPVLHIGRPWALHEAFPPMLARCDTVLALTAAEAEFVSARGARKVTVVGDGISPGDFANPDGQAIRARLGLGGCPVVGFIGRQDRGKGVVTLIEAMQRVWSTMPEARLVLAGQSANRSQEVNDQLAALPPEQRARVALLDDFPDGEIAGIASACDIVAMPSVEEGFGIAYLEAWMCGRPVIGGRIPTTACVIADGVDGLLAEPSDPDDLSRCLHTLLADPALRDRMGKAGREKTLANFTWDLVTDRWEGAILRATAI
jgi:glycosyltransferase involved in cell wall biosynthesis